MNASHRGALKRYLIHKFINIYPRFKCAKMIFNTVNYYMYLHGITPLNCIVSPTFLQIYKGCPRGNCVVKSRGLLVFISRGRHPPREASKKVLFYKMPGFLQKCAVNAGKLVGVSWRVFSIFWTSSVTKQALIFGPPAFVRDFEMPKWPRLYLIV